MDNVEAYDLVGDNTGPLTESCNLDKGCLVIRRRRICRILITLRYRVRLEVRDSPNKLGRVRCKNSALLVRPKKVPILSYCNYWLNFSFTFSLTGGI